MVDRHAVRDAVEQTGTDAEEDRTGSDDILVPADLWNDSGGSDEDDDLNHDEGEEPDAGHGGRGVVYRLEGEGDVVHLEHEHGEEVEENDRGSAAGQLRPICNHAEMRWRGGTGKGV